MARNGNGNGTAVATYRAPQIAAALQEPTAIEQIRKALPASLSEKVAERFVQVAIRYADDEEIAKCTPQSVVNAVVEAASCGVEVGGPRKHAYLVRYGDQATLQFGYGGLIYQAVRDGAITGGRTHAVYEGDEFYVEEGSTPRVVHRPNLDAARTPDRARYFYAILTLPLPGGSEVFTWMTRAQVEAVRQRSKTKDSPAWRFSFDEMGKKVALKRCFKYVPMGDDLRGSTLATAIERDNRNEFGELGEVDEEAQQAATNENARQQTQARLEDLKGRMGARQQQAEAPLGQDLGEQVGKAPVPDEPPTREQVQRLRTLIAHRAFSEGEPSTQADGLRNLMDLGRLTASGADDWDTWAVSVLVDYMGAGSKASDKQVKKVFASLKELGDAVPEQARADMVAEIRSKAFTSKRAREAIDFLGKIEDQQKEDPSEAPYNWEDLPV